MINSIGAKRDGKIREKKNKEDMEEHQEDRNKTSERIKMGIKER